MKKLGSLGQYGRELGQHRPSEAPQRMLASLIKPYIALLETHIKEEDK